MSRFRILSFGLAVMLSATAGACGSSSDGGTGSSGGTGGSAGTGGSGGTGGSAGTGGASGSGGSACGNPTGGPLMVELPEGYCIDATEVTRSQYEAWLDTNPSTSGQISACTWNDDFAPDYWCMQGSYVCQLFCDSRPQVCVDWCDAYAYCAGVGKRLCGKIGGGANEYYDYADASKSQWYAACTSGGANTYPYGAAYEAQTCNGRENDVAGCVSGTCTPAKVGTLSGCSSSDAGYTGIYDLSGNVWEWEDSCNGSSCRLRGGSVFNAGVFYLGCDTYHNGDQDLVNEYVGFRCCSSP